MVMVRRGVEVGESGKGLEPSWGDVPELRGAGVIKPLFDHLKKWLFK